MHNRDKFTIGRGRSCHFILNDKSVSSLHAEIAFTEDGRIKLTDLGSLNGTFRRDGDKLINITKAYVSPSDTVRFGSTELKVKEIVEALHLLKPPRPPGGGGQRLKKNPLQGKRLVRCVCGNVKSPGKPCNVCGSVTTGTYK
ncbi:MAG: FHA domain-containing protein [Desulfarculaceae bacterium]|nr:FHA domain-containing protein [Desulfarculaceae bacterium]MCF8072131.1 FHA domain-containing protein [Desulfarculaceae bacterium]MCF8100052.1 FHA domain-containing protein [Desulfarculaceae bacterium]MCF8118259.1 FHA domain-containing protein [Desulfarculaceae bacterium]